MSVDGVNLIVPDEAPRCQVMLENKTQCINKAWATLNDVFYCRLHFSYAIAKSADVPVGTVAINPIDNVDLSAVLDQKQKSINEWLDAEAKHKEQGVADIAGA